MTDTAGEPTHGQDDAFAPVHGHRGGGENPGALIATTGSVLSNGQLAGRLVPGDKLLGQNGESWRVNSVEPGRFSGSVCGIKVDGTAWYFANGLLVDGRPLK